MTSWLFEIFVIVISLLFPFFSTKKVFKYHFTFEFCSTSSIPILYYIERWQNDCVSLYDSAARMVMNFSFYLPYRHIIWLTNRRYSTKYSGRSLKTTRILVKFYLINFINLFSIFTDVTRSLFYGWVNRYLLQCSFAYDYVCDCVMLSLVPFVVQQHVSSAYYMQFV